MDQSRYMRPMNFGEILDSSVHVYRDNFLQLAVTRLPMTLFGLIISVVSLYIMRIDSVRISAVEEQFFFDLTIYSVENYYTPFHQWIMFSVILFQIAVVYPLALSAITRVVSEGLLGIPSSMKNAYHFSIQNWYRIGLTNIIITGIISAIYFTFFTFIFATNALFGSSFEGLRFYLIFFTGQIIMGIIWARLAVTYPIIVNENKFVFEAIKQSWKMVKGQTSKTFFALLIAILIPHSIIWLVTVIEIIIGRSLTLSMLVAGTAAMGLLIPLLDTVRVVVYFELKARKEGFDLMRRMEDLEKGHIRR